VYLLYVVERLTHSSIMLVTILFSIIVCLVWYVPPHARVLTDDDDDDLLHIYLQATSFTSIASLLFWMGSNITPDFEWERHVHSPMNAMA
jgi:Na+-driven multidrug efflux pump